MLKGPRKPKELARDQQGSILMTKANLKVICENEDGCYEYPELNDKIYLHFKGFNHIENLEEYTNLKTLWLDNNCLRRIENISHLTKLICLFLQNNMLEEITGLEPLTNLQILNLSHNKITKLKGLETLTSLTNLDISFNHLSTVDTISHLAEIPSLTNIDLSNNYLEYHVDFLETFQKLPNLACLYMRNTAIVRETPNYRKNYICHLKNLKYLDDRPVFPDERKVSEAWGVGGREAETEMRKTLNDEKRSNQKKVAEEFRKTSEENKQKRLFLYEKTFKEYGEELERLKELKKQAEREGKPSYYLKEYQEDIEIQEKKIADLKESIDNLSLFKPNPYICYSSTRGENGEVKVWHRSREEAEFIKENLVEKIEEPKKEETLDFAETKPDKLEEIKEESGEGVPTKGKNALEILKEGALERNQGKEKKEGEWEKEYDELLERLLEKFRFDFGKTCEEFNRVVREVDRKMGKENRRVFEERELRMRWTDNERKIRGMKPEINELEELE